MHWKEQLRSFNNACKDASTGWSCTEFYNNTLYAKYVCPFNSVTCGSTDTYNLTEVGKTVNLSMGLTRGDVCFYKIKTKCGLPKVDLTRVDNSDNILIEYIEYESGTLFQGTSYVHGKHGSAPGSEMPYRTETFVYDSDRKVYQGRLINGQGFHIWGSRDQGTQSGLPSGSENCKDRYTYLIFTSLTDTASTVKVGIETITYSSASLLKISFIVIYGISMMIVFLNF
ncbi:UNKNOWN [Stylonychia lemnae]|uniref:Uncharacterized protein n=1 Tax=Stylonychia lemnae TaxID=5949 RepID=A0A078A9N7_STYLE|nr:UNKNOWN [Stylonychia lemnae]|eukprot:CDW78894.1 UNKNOWN [Stylonychia lemnae]